MRRCLTLLLALGLATLSACGQGTSSEPSGDGTNGDAEELKEEESEVNGVNVSVSAETVGDQIEATITLINTTDQDVHFQFSSGQQYELILKNEAGDTVYRYSDDKMFTMALIDETLAAGESKTWTESIPAGDLESGTYTLLAEVVVAAVDGESVPKPSPYKAQTTVIK
ncbi:hypothetical protein E2L07_08515 [Halalkalibacterium halodurans]|uniref:Intracellular proteinase inhibitor n=1 Tax=Halalkalibacterium halodurans (strain ATCC BAA-125 / DSM 18197 / FERM 7344 / JCM 9153 / C-125) TaxID=272558 RepID=Q9K8T7_HALH5|nr:BsuPI-related putative proteinase inhibitor [Halalkalibacterium halodurans]MED4126438.1 BsuPI-related putative proteinase inhibitor [Halalkalibacterium halodurans]MED4174680.1 BsuPI-related putative proteinase inhibitor [Halalkalibacterium halodurans]TES54958.1 hypothetical protein E2L07_08515 [Halalkalibacterium halodurans]BAB06634.1 intracellular proteinase inhibitor [Halalkalibacterium halodurans C-125]